MPLSKPLRFASAKRRLLKSRNWMSGAWIRGSIVTKSTKLTKPMARMAIVTDWGSSGNPSMLNAKSIPKRPMLKVILPNQSMGWRSKGRTGSRKRQIPHITPNIPIGTLKRNTQRQDHSVSNPPIIGPIRKPAAPAIWFTPRPSPTSPFLNASVTITVLLVISRAAPKPWTTRPTMRSAPWNCGCAKPAMSEPTVKATKPLL